MGRGFWVRMLVARASKIGRDRLFVLQATMMLENQIPEFVFIEQGHELILRIKVWSLVMNKENFLARDSEGVEGDQDFIATG